MQSAAKLSSHGIDLGNLRSWLMNSPSGLWAENFPFIVSLQVLVHKTIYFPVLLIIIIVIPNPLKNAPHIHNLWICHKAEKIIIHFSNRLSLWWTNRRHMPEHVQIFYRIQLSNWCRSIIQVLCSQSDILTSQNKSLTCQNELNGHSFLCRILQQWIGCKCVRVSRRAEGEL